MVEGVEGVLRLLAAAPAGPPAKPTPANNPHALLQVSHAPLHPALPVVLALHPVGCHHHHREHWQACAQVGLEAGAQGAVAAPGLHRMHTSCARRALQEEGYHRADGRGQPGVPDSA